MLQRSEIDPDNVLSTYSILEKIGQGSQAKIFKGLHLKSNKEVALKIFEKAFMEMDDIESAKSEVKFLRRLNHPNIIQIIDVFENDDTFIIILPLL